MLEVMISWIYLGMICIIVGYGIGKLLEKIVHIGQQSLMQCMVTGIVGITVYTEYLSIIYKIGALAQSIVLIICFMIIVIYRRQLALKVKKIIHQMVSWEGVFYLMLAIFFAFFVSRGEFHTDTNIYHAANIRIYEEVGLIKGMTNLQWNFGYNSAALAFAAFFSLGWLLPQPLHVTTGFFELIFAVYACHYLKNWRVHKTHMGDACCIAIWVYILVILVRSMSPATDFMAMLLALYGITAWIINCESKKNISEYAMLSVFMVYS